MIGTTVGHYRVLERIGGGGMGVVYRAYDEFLAAWKAADANLPLLVEAKKEYARL